MFQLISSLRLEGCNVVTIAVTEEGRWLSHTAGAPEFVNRAFPTDLGEGLPLIVRCGEPDATAPPTSLIHRVTYEEGETRLESAQIETGSGLGIIDGAGRLGGRAGEALLREGDPPFRRSLGFRAEWQSAFRAQQEVEYWYGFSYFLPPDWNQGRNPATFDDRIVLQFHEGTGAPPAFSLHLRAEDSRFIVRRRAPGGTFEYFGLPAFTSGRWYDFAFQVIWTHEDHGEFTIYLDGRPVHRYEGPTLVDGSSIYTKWGIYGQPTRILFDEVRIAEGRDALALVNP